jgi:transcription antitermination factor NusG
MPTPQSSPKPIDAALSWYVVRAATNRERKAVAGLEEVGFGAYLPCRTRWVRHARVKAKVKRPLFVGYLFVGIDHERQNMRAAAEVDGVHAFVRLGGVAPRAVNAGIVEAIWAAEVEGVFDETKPPTVPRIGKGALLRITGGPFYGFVVQALDVPNKDKIRVLLSVFGRESPMEVDVRKVELVA